MEETHNEKLAGKKMLVFDLDGTLAASKADIDKEMADLLCELLEKKQVAVIGGGNNAQFTEQCVNKLRCPEEHIQNLSILPTSGGRMYRYHDGTWRLIYENNLTKEEKEKIRNALTAALKETRHEPPEKIHGKTVEDRGGQITFSSLGQNAPLEEKKQWNRNNDIRAELKRRLEQRLPDFEIRLGGLTSVDITKKGIDKAYGLRQIEKHLSVPISSMIYIGDALYEGGNDSAVTGTGIETIPVSGPEETKKYIKHIL